MLIKSARRCSRCVGWRKGPRSVARPSTWEASYQARRVHSAAKQAKRIKRIERHGRFSTATTSSSFLLNDDDDDVIPSAVPGQIVNHAVYVVHQSSGAILEISNGTPLFAAKIEDVKVVLSAVSRISRVSILSGVSSVSSVSVSSVFSVCSLFFSSS